MAFYRYGDGGSHRQAARAASSCAPGASQRSGPRRRIIRNRRLDAPDRRARFERLQSAIADKLERDCVRDGIVDADATEENEVLCVDSFRTGEMVPVRFLPRGSASTPGTVRAASDRAFRANPTAPLQTRVRRARDAGYRTGLNEERHAIIQGLGMSSEIPLATPGEAELVFSLLRGSLMHPVDSMLFEKQWDLPCALR